MPETQEERKNMIDTNPNIALGIQRLHHFFGQDIVYTLRNPKPDDDILIRSDVPTMFENASSAHRNHIVKISDSDRNNTTTHQLALCLGTLYMKIYPGPIPSLYIQTQDPVLTIDSPISDRMIDSFISKQPEAIYNQERMIENPLVENFFETQKENIQTIRGNIFARPLLIDNRLESILADQTINNPLATSYRGLAINPGAYIFPYYTHNSEGKSRGQLIVSIPNALAIQ